jgi:hypothetical protein
MSEKKAKLEKKESISWMIAADRAVLGERTELKSLPGYWVQPRRLSKAGEAEIAAVQARGMAKQQGIRRAILAEQSTDGMSEADKMAGMIPLDVQERIYAAVIDNLDAETVGQIEAKVCKIAYGVAEHNFESPDGGPATVAWARSLAEYGAVFDEILGIVEEKNLPL